MAKGQEFWAQAAQRSADPKRAEHYFKLFCESPHHALLAELPEARQEWLATLFAGSDALSASLLAHPDWLALFADGSISHLRRLEGLERELKERLQPVGDQSTGALPVIRLFKQREMLRIAVRDLCRMADAVTITRELSDLADVVLQAVWNVCFNRLRERHGVPRFQQPSGKWEDIPACLIGLGKLGGQELNYSSDIDVIFVYAEEGHVWTTGAEPSITRMTAHQFFNRLAEAVIAEVSAMAPEGFLYRIDLRLRPEGGEGPLTRALAGYENFYAQWGQTWERMMLIKARRVAGDKALGAEFVEMISPFRYARSINPNVLREIAATKERIEREVVKSGELSRNVKLGVGGIREIEFVAQTHQLIHGGRQPFLQGSQTLPTLEKLAQYGYLPPKSAQLLREAYCFLRDVEHRAQMEGNLQTHTIPARGEGLTRLAKLMGFSTVPAFEEALCRYQQGVRAVFEELLGRDHPEQGTLFPAEFEKAQNTWEKLLSQHAFKDVPKALVTLREFVEGPGFVHVSPRTRELALGLLPRLFALCPNQPSKKAAESKKHEPGSEAAIVAAPLSDPDRVLMRLDSFIAAYGARGTLFELWNRNPAIFELLVKLFDRSEFLAERAIRTPDLVDELVASDRLRKRKASSETFADLMHGIDDKDQHLWIRRYHETELMRIGLRDILGMSPAEQCLEELSALAEAVLAYALASVMKRRRIKRPPFAIIGLGKLGGREIDYGSDLDIIFVAPAAKNIQPPVLKIAAEIIDLVGKRTEQGLVFHTDARLRPDGEKGLLVNSLDRHEEYYRSRAQLWEIQALTRARAVAGDLRVGKMFEEMAGRFTDFRTAHPLPSAYQPDWRRKIDAMRHRIETERTPAGKDHLAIKTGIGGLMDAEFAAQILALENGWQEANTLRVLEKASRDALFPAATSLTESYRRLRRVEAILRRWSYEGETVLPAEPEPFYRVSIRCGFPDAESFRQALAGWRKDIRAGYVQVLESAPG